MFPHVHGEQCFAFATSHSFAHERIVLVGSRNDFEFAAVGNEPRPAAAEATNARRLKLRLEIIEAAERGFDVVSELAGGSAARVRGHELPEERMIPMTAAVVAHRTANRVGHGSEIAEDLFERLGFERGVTGDGFVQVIYVGLVMAAVVDFHGERVNVRFERGFVVGKIREFVWHNGFQC